MFYGRVDVYWPDGPVESYRLNKSTIAIGRSTGNDIVLETTSISRYHITLTIRDQNMVLEDLASVNGTYVDGDRLEAHAPRILRGGEEVQIGDVRLIYHPPIEEIEADLESETTQRVVLSQPTYQIELEGPDIPVAPGAHAQAALRVENQGDETDCYFVEVDGLPKGWVRADRVEIELDAGEHGYIQLSLKPLRRSESVPGDHAFTVRVRSQSQPSETLDVPATLRVLPFSGFGLALGNERIDSGSGFKLYMHNQGNAPLRLAIQGIDSNQALRFQLPASQVQLAPGERQTFIGSIEPRQRRLFGPPRDHEFALSARALDASSFIASVPGTYVERGLLPTWVPMLALPLVLVAVGLFAVLLLLLLDNNDSNPPARQPSILSLTVSSPAIMLGDTVELTWDVSDAAQIDVFIEHGDTRQPFAFASSAPPVTVPFDQAGLYTLVLEAQNDDLLSTAAVTVEVRPVVSLTVEPLSGPELFYYVRQQVQIQWSVSGAREFDGGYQIWLESPNQPDPLLAAPLPLSGQQQIPIIPDVSQAEWLVTLYAQGQDDVIAGVTQTLPIVHPVCELTATRTIIRSGPGDTYLAVVPPLESSPEGNPWLSPIARDPSGEWLQVNVGVDNPRAGWVPLRDFNCLSFDPAQLVITDEFPPPPTPPTPPAPLTATPAAQPTPTATATPAQRG